MTERVLLDTCVLYPTLLRQLLLETAEAGLFTPLWSPRILDEWRHAAARSGQLEATLTEGEIARITALFPDASTLPDPTVTQSLVLPDPDDAHVLAAAIAGRADSLLTVNLKDFPTRVLGHNGLFRREPDTFLLELRDRDRDVVTGIVKAATQKALSAIGSDATPRSLLKRARLPRLGKALFASR
jgi:predicted nucleic acid-binding protein